MNNDELVFLIFFVLPLFYLFWLPKEEIIAHGIIPPWSNNLFNLSFRYSLSWFVGSNYDITSTIFYFYSAIFSFIGGSVSMGQSLFFYFGFLLCELGIYFLGRNLGLSKITSLISGIIYMLIPVVYSGFPVEPVNLRVLPFYFSTPFLLILTIKILSGKHYKKYLAILGIFSFFILSISYSSLQYFVLNILIILSYTIYHLIQKLKLYKQIIKKFILILLILLISNAYWFLIFVNDLNSSYLYRTEVGCNDVDTLKGLSANIIDSIRMMPYIHMPSAYPFYEYYYNPIIMIIMFFFVFLSIISLFSKNKIVPYLWVVLLISLFLQSGLISPFGDINSIIFLTIPYITRLFRNPLYFSCLSVIFFSLLVGFGFNNLYNYYNKNKKILTLFGVILIIFGIPFFTGTPISYTKDKPAQSILLPEYIIQTTDFLNNEKLNYHTIEIPTFTDKLQYVILNFRNKTYWGGSPLLFSSDKMNIQSILNGVPEPVLVNSLHPTEDIIDYETWLKVMQITNVKNVILYNNTDWVYFNKTEKLNLTQNALSNFIENSNITEKTNQFGDISIFSLKDEYFLPVIYSGNKIILTNLKLSDLHLIPEINPPIIIFNAEEQSINNISTEYEAPNIEFKKINPTKYRIVIHNSTNSFPLVFSERYYAAWSIYVKDYRNYEIKGEFISKDYHGTTQNDNLPNGEFYETWNLKELNSSHYEVNGYSNLWIINPKLVCQEVKCSENNDFELIIEYKPQKVLIIGWIISISSVFVCFSYLSLILIQQKLLKNKKGKSR